MADLHKTLDLYLHYDPIFFFSRSLKYNLANSWYSASLRVAASCLGNPASGPAITLHYGFGRLQPGKIK